MINFRLTLTGTAPLLMHNGRLADPIDPAAKALAAATSKRTKTDADHAEVARLEWHGGLYWDEDLNGPYIPGENIAKCLRSAAKMTKHGKAFDRGLMISTEINPLVYNGPRDRDKLAADANFVHRKCIVVAGRRVPRTRPMFREWKVDCEGVIDPNVLDLETVRQAAETAGQFEGLGDWRPGSPRAGGTFGRFTAELEKL